MDFCKLSNKLNLLLKQNNKIEEINLILNDLNSMDFTVPIPPTQRSDILNLMDTITHIPTNDETLVVKSSFLCGILFNKQKVQLSQVEFCRLTEWFLKALYSNFENVACDVLPTIQCIFKLHPQYCQNYWTAIISPQARLIKYLNDVPMNVKIKKKDIDAMDPMQIVMSIVPCVDCLLYVAEDTAPDVGLITNCGEVIMKLLLSNRIEPGGGGGSIKYLNFLIASLNILNKVCLINRAFCEEHVGDLLGVSKSFILIGIPGISDIPPKRVPIAAQSIVDPSAEIKTKGGKVAKTRKPRTVARNKPPQKPAVKEASTDGSGLKIDFDHPLQYRQQTSDSDFSESESSKVRSERQKYSKIRLSAISLIGVVVKSCERKVLYGYWHCLFPSDADVPISLMSCALRDPNPRCRIAALQVSSVLIFGSKTYLSQAENSEKAPSTYTPFAVTLGNTIILMYEQLTQLLATENMLPVLTQILKCLSVLIQATPFHRLKSGFIPPFVQYVRRFITHKDPSITVGALMVMEFLVSVPEITEEISTIVGIPRTVKNVNDSGLDEIISDNEEEEEICSDVEDEPTAVTTELPNEERNVEVSWLLETVLANLGIYTRKPPIRPITKQTPIRIESLQVLTALTKHFQLLKNHMSLVALAIIHELKDGQSEIKLYAAKCLDSFGHELSNFIQNSSEIQEGFAFWTTVYPIVVEVIQDRNNPSSILTSTLCDYLSNVGVHIFEKLDHSNQMQLISFLSGVACHEESAVKASAIRALAVYALFPSVRGDLCFIENTAESILGLMGDPILFVRVKVSWALANVSESLLNTTNTEYDRISDFLLQRLLTASKEAAGDNDKVKSNIVRSIGNLLRLITSKHLESASWRSLISECIEKLTIVTKTGNNAKVKWNACYSMGNLMKNGALFTSYGDLQWQGQVFNTLSQVIVNNVNFKVRINGAAALITIKERQYYGQSFFLSIWNSLLLAMEHSDILVDFGEYKHRDNLQEQLCFCLSHFIDLAQKDDFNNMKESLAIRSDLVKHIWIRVVNRVLPQQSDPLIRTVGRLQELSPTADLRLFCDCFTDPNVGFK